MSKSKRLHLTIKLFIANFIICGFGIYMKSYLSALGAGLALLNAPLYAYIFGETMRPSEKKKKITKQILND